MAPGRPRLDPDVKLQHTQDSRRRYDEKNAAERREAARLRMQRCRAAIANSDVITKHKYARKAAEAAENYRYRKHQEQRAEQRAFDAARKKAREAEVLALHKKHTARKPIAASAPLRPIAEPPAVFSKLRDRLQRCSHCYEEDCLGASLDRMLERYPHAYTWEAAPWLTFDRMWNLDCTEYHNHQGEHPEFLDPSPPSSPTKPATARLSTPASPTKSISARPISAAPPPYVSPLEGGLHGAVDARTDTGETVKPMLSKEELSDLANFRPGAGPISTRRLNQQFARALGPQAVAPSVLVPQRSSKKTPVITWVAQQRPLTPPGQGSSAQSSVTVAAQHPHTPRRDQHPRTPRQNRAKAASQDPSDTIEEGGVMYAVSGHNRVFQDRGRALAVLQRSPGAELVFTRNEDEVFKFLAEDVVCKMTI
ncbi:hypothetical protein DFH09DRAFT_1320329 [Mycena vulgaris]|nr:hypothetical protein DFH09DRAFT_1320329 [Mycena vulgaris]